MYATIGVNGRVIQVESVAIVGEVDGVRHRRVIELAGDFVLYLAGDVEGAAWGFLTLHASRHCRGDIGDLATVLQPGAATVQVNTHLGIRWARTTVKLVSAALCFRLACGSLGASLLSGNALGISAGRSLASLACFLILLSNQTREEEFNGAIHRSLNARSQLRRELLRLVQNLVAGVPRLLAGLAVEIIQLCLCISGEPI